METTTAASMSTLSGRDQIAAQSILDMNRHLGYILGGSLAALGASLTDYYLPPWLKIPCIGAHCLLGEHLALYQLLRYRQMSSRARLASIVCAFTCICLLCFSIDPRHRLTVWFGLVSYLSELVAAAWIYILYDGPPSPEAVNYFANRDVSAAYFLALLLISYRTVAWRALKIVLFWGTLLPFGFGCSLWILSLFPSLWKILRPPVKFLLQNTIGKLPEILDPLRFCEAYLVGHVPTAIYKGYLRQQGTLSSADMADYEYQSLPEGHIRVLVLDRSKWFKPTRITAGLHHVSLEDLPPYEAASYCWGSSDLDKEIILDGKRFAVTTSAYNLLLARRSTWWDRTIWIDGICINQSDDQEKTAQVRLMQKIYARASRVIVFLGDDWRLRLAAKMIFEQYAFQLGTTAFQQSRATAVMKERSSVRWRAVVELLTNEYFTRAWIVQEIVMGRDVHIYAGGFYIPWYIFLAVSLHHFHPHRQSILSVQPGSRLKRTYRTGATFENIAKISLLQGELKVEGIRPAVVKRSLETVLFLTSRFQSKDARDRVFAMLGMVDEDDSAVPLISPDYTKSTRAVFTAATEYIMLRPTPSVHILALSGIGFTQDRKGIPSWIPDFSEENRHPYATILDQEHPYTASGPTIAVVRRDVQDPDVLVLRGLVCNNILAICSTTLSSLGTEGESIGIFQAARTKRAVLAEMLGFVRDHGNLWSESVDVVQDQLWRAITADRIEERFPADPRFRSVFYSWVKYTDFAADCRDETDAEARLAAGELAEIWPAMENGDVAMYESSFKEVGQGRRLAITDSGSLCLVPPLSRVGDIVFVPLGSQTPYVIRLHVVDGAEANAHYQIVGDAYVHGLMAGEALSQFEQTDLRFR